MIFIFGISPKQSVIGPAEERICPQCNNRKFWSLIKETNWFSLFFIPIIPFGTKYFLTCPICRMSESLSKEEFERKEQMVKLNQEALKGNMNSTDYEQTYTDLK